MRSPKNSRKVLDSRAHLDVDSHHLRSLVRWESNVNLETAAPAQPGLLRKDRLPHVPSDDGAALCALTTSPSTCCRLFRAGAHRAPMWESRKTFDEVAVEFLKFQALRNPDQHRASSIAAILGRSFGPKRLDQIRTKDIETHIADRRLNGAAPATCNRERAFLSRLYNWSIDRGDFIGENPVQRVKRFRENREEPRILSPEQARALVHACEPRFRFAMLMALYTGGRRGELRALTPADLDLERGFVRFRKNTTKSRRERFVPLSRRTVEMISVYLAHHPPREWLFEHNGKRLRGLRGALEAARFKVNLPWVTWITFRHTFAGWFLTNGGEVARLQELLGHSNPLTTMIYRHFLPGHGRDVARFIGPPKQTPNDIEGGA